MKEDILQSALKEVQLYGDFQSHKAEIDAEDLSWILQILSTNLYSDPIGSLIREYSSNAWDANVEAGNKDKPIEVGIQTSADTGSYWYVTDLGPGLSPQRINDVYRKFGKSTKRNSNEAIGMMGLGKFSGLSYSNEIFISTRVDGMQYEYLMHKSDGVPQIDLLTTKLVDLPNGTTIKVNIKNWSDRRSFETKTQEQLAFFENVFFNIDNNPSLNQDFKVLKGKTFTMSSLESRDLRLKIGPVSYPIDWDAIKGVQNTFLDGIAGLKYALKGCAINFNIGDLAITPNRESVLYNKSTIANIEKNIKAFALELIDIYNNNVEDYEDLEDYVNALNNPLIKLDGKTILVQDFLNICNIPKKYPMLKDLGLKLNVQNMSELFYGYTVSCRISNGRKKEQNYYGRNMFNPDPGRVNGVQGGKIYTILLKKESLDPKRNKFISEKYGINDWTVIKRTKTAKLLPPKGDASARNCYFNILKLQNVPKSQWRATINKFITWQDAYIAKYTIDYDSENPTKDWLKAQKQDKVKNDLVSLRKSTGKILVRPFVQGYGSYSPPVTSQTDWKLAELHKHKFFTIYGTEDDKAKLKLLYHFTNLNVKLKVVITAKTNHKYLENLSSYMHIDKFMEGKTKYFGKFVSLYKLQKNFSKIEELNKCKSLLTALNSDITKKLLEAEEKAKEFKRIAPHGYNFREEWEKLLESMEQVATQNNMLDWEIEALNTEVHKIYDKYSFLEHIASIPGSYSYKGREYSKEQIEFAVFVCKVKQVKLSLNWYQNAPEIKEENQ